MQIIQHRLWDKEEYQYPVSGDFAPTITSYIHEEEAGVLPALIIIPGGGYAIVSNSEGEIAAKKFYNMGYQTFVVTYTTNLLMNCPLRLQPLKDLSRAISYVRKNGKELCVDIHKVAICGFSAGGHLAGSLAVHFNARELIEQGTYAGISNRPDAVILSYPVINSGKYIHEESFFSLFGAGATEEEMQYMSLERQVTENTPPVFLWHAAADTVVPMENSLMFAQACWEKGVHCELHIFGNGKHGMSLANEEWAAGVTSGLYSMEQFFCTLQPLSDQGKELPPPFDAMGEIPRGTDIKELYIKNFHEFRNEEQPDAGIAVWPDLAGCWLEKQWGAV